MGEGDQALAFQGFQVRIDLAVVDRPHVAEVPLDVPLDLVAVHGPVVKEPQDRVADGHGSLPTVEVPGRERPRSDFPLSRRRSANGSKGPTQFVDIY
jgi:hypothetical protein